jgi:hypothetical protein
VSTFEQLAAAADRALDEDHFRVILLAYGLDPEVVLCFLEAVLSAADDVPGDHDPGRLGLLSAFVVGVELGRTQGRAAGRAW